MKSPFTEIKLLVYTLVAVMFLVTIHVFHPQLSAIYDPVNFLSIHIALELFAISISFAIFFYGWRKYEETKSGKLLMLAMLFLIVGLLDLLHTLTFKGMPFFLTESSVAKTTWFWIITRTFEAVFMVVLLLLPEWKQKIDYRPIWFTLSIGFVISVAIIVFQYANVLPVLVIEGQGTTFLKNTIEYFVCFLRIVTIIIALLFYYDGKKIDFLYMALAFTILFLSELIFTVYQSIYDIDNFTGHLYKVVGYFFFLKAFYLSIEKETLSEDQYHRKGFQLNDLIHEHPGIVFTVKRLGNSYVHCVCDGELLYELGLTPEEVVGKTIFEFIPLQEKLIEEQYQSSWETGTNATFHFEFKEKSLFVSLKPLFRQNEVVEILGTVIDLSKIETKHNNDRLHWYASQH